jgi:acetyl-CoA acetyltransferase
LAVVPGNTVSIAAASITDIGQFPDRSSVDLAEEALDSALGLAGLNRPDIDGFVWNLGAGLGANYDTVCTELGLRPSFVVQTWTHGRFTGTCLELAAMAVASGAATTVACLGGIKGAPWRGAADRRKPGSGLEVFVRPAVSALSLYLEQYGADRDRLADIVLSAHRYAALNPRAWVRTSFTAADYVASPMLLEPLKLADCFPTDESYGPINDSGVCVLVTKTERAPADRPRVYIVAGQGIQAGPEEMYFGRPGLSDPQHAYRPGKNDLAAFTETGLTQADIDGFYTYDAFAPTIWYSLERFGYCEAGEAPDFVTAGRIWRDGDLPVNTNGGMLSAGHTAGWGQIVEMVDQLQGAAGPRQIEGAELLHWGSVFGDSVILTNNPDACVRA